MLVKMASGQETDIATSDAVVDMSDTTAVPVAAGDNTMNKGVDLDEGSVNFPQKVSVDLIKR